MNQALVSVVVATYRRTRSLAAALSSLGQQSYPALEVVLVDDNGQEEWNRRVSEVVAQFRAEYPEIQLQHLVNCPNRGSAEARNVGIRAARGEYITFLDDDDLYLPEKVSRQYAAMVDSGADYSITDLFLYHESGKLIDRRVRWYLEKAGAGDLLKMHLQHHMTGTDTMMFRGEYLRQIGGFPGIDVGDEFYLMKEAISAGGRFYYLPGCDVKAYVHEGEEGLSAGETKINGENQLYEYKKSLFGQIDSAARRYITMRHYAVLAFAELRRKRYGAFFEYALRSFVSAPLSCLKLLSKRAGV